MKKKETQSANSFSITSQVYYSYGSTYNTKHLVRTITIKLIINDIELSNSIKVTRSGVDIYNTLSIDAQLLYILLLRGLHPTIACCSYDIGICYKTFIKTKLDYVYDIDIALSKLITCKLLFNVDGLYQFNFKHIMIGNNELQNSILGHTISNNRRIR